MREKDVAKSFAALAEREGARVARRFDAERLSRLAAARVSGQLKELKEAGMLGHSVFSASPAPGAEGGVNIHLAEWEPGVRSGHDPWIEMRWSSLRWESARRLSARVRTRLLGQRRVIEELAMSAMKAVAVEEERKRARTGKARPAGLAAAIEGLALASSTAEGSEPAPSGSGRRL